jgi:hypothetical protein
MTSPDKTTQRQEKQGSALFFSEKRRQDKTRREGKTATRQDEETRKDKTRKRREDKTSQNKIVKTED